MRNPYPTPTKKRVRSVSTASGRPRKLFKPFRKMVQGAYHLNPVKTVKNAYRFGYNLGYNLTHRGTQTVKQRRSRGYGGSSQIGPKIKADIAVKSKKNKVNGKWTKTGIERKGITFNIEERKTVSAEEALVLAHTSLPGKFTALNFWRALIKHCMLRVNIIIKDYGNVMTNEGFQPGDLFQLNYYNGPSAMTTSAWNFGPLTSSITYDQLAIIIWEFLDNQDVIGFRLDSFVYVPSSVHPPRVGLFNVQINTLKVAVVSQSKLHVQNVTVEDPNDDEADDVNAVPLVGKIFKTRGNNFLQKSNRKVLPGLMNEHQDAVLFEAYQRQSPTFAPGTSAGFYGPAGAGLNSIQTTFTKPADIPRIADIDNLVSHGGAQLDPGQIRHLVTSERFEMTFTAMFELLYFNKTHRIEGFVVYNPKLGHCQSLYLEKKMGRAVTDNNNIRLWIQHDLTQSILVFGKNSEYTQPIQYQYNFD